MIEGGLIPKGEVDDRSIKDVRGNDLKGFTQCHFFAGIAGWSFALKLAGWPEDREVWTGSCPCQPFSQAGKRRGFNDERHLWPIFYELIKERKPSVVFGEQVSSKDGVAWFDGVSDDMEKIDYACTAFDIPAACVDSDQIRQRLFWVADSRISQRERIPSIGRDTISSVRGISEAIQCEDGKLRRIKPGIRLLVDGFPGRRAQIRAFGNAIHPAVAAEFIKTYLEITLF